MNIDPDGLVILIVLVGVFGYLLGIAVGAKKGKYPPTDSEENYLLKKRINELATDWQLQEFRIIELERLLREKSQQYEDLREEILKL